MSDRPLVVFAAGGTGGHLFPALAVADAITRQRDDIDVAFYTTDRPIDTRILGHTEWLQIAQPIQPLPRLPWRWPRFVSRWVASHHLCRRRWKTRRPSVVVGTGGFGSLPPVRVARRLGVRRALLNPDAIPGRANGYLGRSADAVLVQWESTARFFPRAGMVRVTGCPVRSDFRDGDQVQAASRLGLDRDRKTLLVTGASQGARTVNEALIHLADSVARCDGWQVLHLTGELDLQRVRGAYVAAAVPGLSLPFCDTMADAIIASDLVISRAGASTLAELTAVGRPAILMPYPFHRDGHQMANANELVERGAAEVIADHVDPADNAARLGPVLEALMADEDRLTHMADAARALGRPDAAVQVAKDVLRLVDHR